YRARRFLHRPSCLPARCHRTSFDRFRPVRGPFHKDALWRHRLSVEQWNTTLPWTMRWFALTKQLQQGRQKIDVTDGLIDSHAATLPRHPNQIRHPRCFFEHHFLSKKLMCAEAVPMVARVHNDRLLHQAEPFQRAKDGFDTSIYQRYQPEVSQFDPAVFFRRNTSIVQLRKAYSIKYSVGVLALADQTVPQRDRIRRRSECCFIEVHVSERMLLIQRPVVRCV